MGMKPTDEQLLETIGLVIGAEDQVVKLPIINGPHGAVQQYERAATSASDSLYHATQTQIARIDGLIDQLNKYKCTLIDENRRISQDIGFAMGNIKESDKFLEVVESCLKELQEKQS